MKKVDLTLYNGRTPEQIQNNFPENMPQVHRDLYMKNVQAVIERQLSGYNQNEIEAYKDFNFGLASHYYYELNSHTL